MCAHGYMKTEGTFPKIEILAPAGNPQALQAALRCGADAVYLGGCVLNARQNAQNFDEAALERAVYACHAAGVKVYLTLNTLVADAQLADAGRMVETACRLAVDAVIVQDLGLAAWIHAAAPQLPLHASTQMSVQTLAGIKLLQSLGFSRVVLPRELSHAELQALAKSSPLELELFVHGAHCMSVSGQCFFSAVLGGRSGNRGLCAQPCRLPFSSGVNDHALSLKDLSLLAHIPQLAGMGIRSLKIEGRMKRPEYVAAAVTACRKAVDGQVDAALATQLRNVFSRSGFTDGYYRAKRDAAMFGIRQKEDVTAAAEALPPLQKLYETQPQTIPVEMTFAAGETVSLCAAARGQVVTVTGEAPQRAQKKATTRADVEQQLRKTGGTPYYSATITATLPDGLFVPVSQLNALRRAALEKLTEALAYRKPIPFSPQTAPTWCAAASAAENRKTASAPVLHGRFATLAQLPADLSALALVVVPLDTPAETLQALTGKTNTLAVEIPRGIFGDEERIAELLQRAKSAGITAAFCGTLDGVSLAKQAGLHPLGGFGLHVFNTGTLAVLRQLGVKQALLSCELQQKQIDSLGDNLPRSLFAYGRIPLMLCRNNPGGESLLDRKGVAFPLGQEGGATAVYNSVPVWLAQQLPNLAAQAALLYFTTETSAEVQAVIAAFRLEKAAPGSFTRGLYLRGVE